MMCKLHNIEQMIDHKMFGHLATHLQCDQVVCPGSHRVHLIHGRRGIVTIHADCCLHTGVQPSCTITTISPSLLDFYYAYIKRPSTASIAPRCDAPTGLQHCSGFSHNEAECQVLSPLPRAGLSSPRRRRPHFPTSPSHWCQVSVSRTRYIIQYTEPPSPRQMQSIHCHYDPDFTHSSLFTVHRI